MVCLPVPSYSMPVGGGIVEVSCGGIFSMVPDVPVLSVQVNVFVPDYWGGDIYHDVDKAFYKVGLAAD